jgi:hypothetical protein
MVTGHLDGKVPAQSRLVAPIFFPNHFDPGFLSVTMLAAKAKKQAMT